jgi:hypothetical protein
MVVLNNSDDYDGIVRRNTDAPNEGADGNAHLDHCESSSSVLLVGLNDSEDYEQRIPDAPKEGENMSPSVL